MRRIYSCLIGLFAPLLFLVFIWRYGLRRTLRGMGERWGKGRPPDSRRRVWFHAASVGEIRALEPLLRGFRRRFPDIERLVTTTSVAGKELAARLDLADMVRLAPLDLENCVRRFLRSWTPRAAVFIETELWPNWIASAADAGVPLLLVNGRMSDRTSGIYRRTRFFWAPLFERFFRLGVQSPLNAERFRAAGASSEKIAVTGNLKYDVPLPDSASRPVLFRRYGFRESDRVLVCGSTHRGEETEIISAFARLLEEKSDMKLILAPRHAERAEELARMLREAGFSFRRRSELGGAESSSADAACLILDTAGELPEVYGLASWAFVGGSLVPRGGQNPLEPARWGVPVLFGPHMQNFREMTDAFLREGAARRVESSSDLVQVLREWLREPEAARRVGAAARRVAESQGGAVEANLDLLAQVLS